MRYEDAGVSIERANALVEWLKGTVGGGIGSFATRVRVPGGSILLSTDGVGTKILLALEYYGLTGKEEVMENLGQDLVAMVSNDILADGGRTLHFLDYYATGRLDGRVASVLLSGVIKACRKVGARLVGGETAELPGMLPEGVFDVAGFGVGVPLKRRFPAVRPGDALVAFPSSGFHSNGYSLIRKIISSRGLDITRPYRETGSRRPLGDLLLRPTRLYARIGREMFLKFGAKRGAHITGGGIPENLPRALSGREARIFWDRIRTPRFMRFILEVGEVPEEEARRVFNMGVGFVFVVPKRRLKAVLRRFKEAYVIGEVV
ncbi:MAG: phosphoribosylformylglycinamidine cyclo-ligase [Thermotogae bacterium]|nr:phosphoribosylformylglycinamidine cyclo-ligase [Thermotogota bacterium]